MRIRFSDRSIIQLVEDINIANPDEFSLVEFANEFDASCRWLINGTTGSSFIIEFDFNTDEGHTRFILMYGDYLK